MYIFKTSLVLLSIILFGTSLSFIQAKTLPGIEPREYGDEIDETENEIFEEQPIFEKEDGSAELDETQFPENGEKIEGIIEGTTQEDDTGNEIEDEETREVKVKEDEDKKLDAEEDKKIESGQEITDEENLRAELPKESEEDSKFDADIDEGAGQGDDNEDGVETYEEENDIKEDLDGYAKRYIEMIETEIIGLKERLAILKKQYSGLLNSFKN